MALDASLECNLCHEAFVLPPKAKKANFEERVAQVCLYDFSGKSVVVFVNDHTIADNMHVTFVYVW